MSAFFRELPASGIVRICRLPINAALFGDEMASSHRRTCRGRGIVQRFLRRGLLINFPMAYLSWGTRNARRIGHDPLPFQGLDHGISHRRILRRIANEHVLR
jgi:hypothetical protein